MVFPEAEKAVINETSLSSCKFKISGRTAIIVHGETADTLPMIRNVTSTLINEINHSNMTNHSNITNQSNTINQSKNLVAN